MPQTTANFLEIMKRKNLKISLAKEYPLYLSLGDKRESNLKSLTQEEKVTKSLRYMIWILTLGFGIHILKDDIDLKCKSS